MKKNKVILILFGVIAIIVYLLIKVNNFNRIRNNVNTIVNSSFQKYMGTYSIVTGKAPIDIPELKEYIKKNDFELYEKVKKINLIFINDDYGGRYYLKGFDDYDDKTTKIYRVEEIGFFKSLTIKGDLVIDLSYDIRKKTNTIYKVEKDSLIEFGKIKPLKFYKSKLDCNSLTKKENNDINKSYIAEYTIRNGEINCFYNSGFTKLSLEALLDGIKNDSALNLKQGFYYYLIKYEDIDMFSCNDRN